MISEVETWYLLKKKKFLSLQLGSNIYRKLEHVAATPHAVRTTYHELSSVQLIK